MTEMPYYEAGVWHRSAVPLEENPVSTPTPTPPPAPAERPNPLRDVAAKIGPAWAALSGVVVALVPLGILSVEQANSVQYVGDSVVSSTTAIAPVVGGVLAAVFAVVQAFTQAKTSKADVTPVADPRDSQGRLLTPDVTR